jgi:hypothetical protein
VHHEDVRRANGEGPRVLDDDMDAILWRMLGFAARMSKKAVKGAALTLRTPDGRERGVSTDGIAVVMTGPPGELTLYMSGRKEAADVTLDGDATGIAIVHAANFGA